MQYYRYRLLIILFSILFSLNFLIAENETHWLTMNTVKTRALSLGGAFTAHSDALPALDFNPAGYRIQPHAPKEKLTIYLNPIGMAGIFALNHSFKLALTPLSLPFKGMGIRYQKAHIGISLGEESLDQPSRLNRSEIFSLDQYEFSQNLLFGFSLVLAPKVSLGFSSELFLRGGNLKHAKMGYRYGIQLKPREAITVGICYMDWPNIYGNDRLPLERLSDEALNVGMVLRPVEWIYCSMDLRNVSDQDKPAEMEPHFGVELQPVSFLMLRMGYFQTKNRNEETLSMGFGLKNSEAMFTRGILSSLFLRCDFAYLKQTSSDWFLLTILVSL